jgi:hypothetical protein
MALPLSLAVCDYDRTRAIFDGRATVEGCAITAVPLEPEEAFHRAFKFNEFDISEISLSSYIMTTARGDAHYVAIPAFVSRLFRHSGIYIRTDRGIARPQDLRGKTIGLPEYQITANVWIRGILKDEYGLVPADIRWRRGGLEDPGRDERAAIKLPPEIDLQAIPEHRTLSDMLAEGQLDGLISARAVLLPARRAPCGAPVPGLSGDRGGLFPQDQNFSDHARHRHPPRAGGAASVARGQRLQGVSQGQGSVHARARPDRASGDIAAVERRRIRPAAPHHGRGFLELWGREQQACSRNLGALFPRPESFDKAAPGRGNVRAVDVRAFEDLMGANGE